MANVQSPSHNGFYLSCVMGERNVNSLQIERDNKVVMAPPGTRVQNYRNRSSEVQARGFSVANLVGILYCLGKTPTEQGQVIYVHNSHYGECLQAGQGGWQHHAVSARGVGGRWCYAVSACEKGASMLRGAKSGQSPYELTGPQTPAEQGPGALRVALQTPGLRAVPTLGLHAAAGVPCG